MSDSYVTGPSANKGFSGMVSGMDTEKLVEELLKGTQAKIDKQNELKQQTTWKQEIYRDLITKINKFRDKYFGVSSETSFLTGEMFSKMKTSTTSDAFSVTTTGLAQAGDWKIDVAQMASKASLYSKSGVSGGAVLNLDAQKLQETAKDGKISLDFELNGIRKNLSLDASSVDAFETSLAAELKYAYGEGAVTLSKSGSQLTLHTSSEGQTLKVFGKDISAVSSQSMVSNKLDRNMRLGDLSINGASLSGENFAFRINGKAFSFTANDSLQKVMDTINASDAGVTISYDGLRDSFHMEATESGRGFGFDFEQTQGNLLTVLFGSDVAGGASSAQSGKLVTNQVSNATLNPDALTSELLNKQDQLSLSLVVNGKTHTFTVPTKKPAEGKDAQPTEYTPKQIFEELNKKMEQAFGKGAVSIDLTNGALTVGKAGLSVSFADKTAEWSDTAALDKAKNSGDLNAIFGLYHSNQNNQINDTTKMQDILGIQTDALTADQKNQTAVNVFNGNHMTLQDGVVTVSNQADPSNAFVQSVFGKNLSFGDGKGGNLDSLAADGRYQAGKNAVVRINGIWTERSRNAFEVDGVSFDLKHTTLNPDEIQIDHANGLKVTDLNGNEIDESKSASVKVEQNNDAIYDSLKNFIDDYNKLIKEMNDLVDEKATYKKYPPLTKEQKKEMSEREIELWEEKAKEGLLRRDSAITDFLGNMRSALYQKPDPEGVALYDIGIETADWRLRGQLVIADQGALKSAIANNPQQIEDLLMGENGLMKQMRNIIDDAAKASSADPGTLVQLAGAKNTATDKENRLQKEMTSIDEKLLRLQMQYESEKKRYWKQFNSMERILADMQSQSAWMGQMMGGGF